MASSLAGGGGGAASGTPGSLATALENPHLIGATWVISSALFTTYSTTKFLKYERAVPSSSLPASTKRKKVGMVSRLSRPELLTLSRFAGSLLLGLLAHPDWRVVERVWETLSAAKHFALPAFFLYIANYMNSVSLDRIGISLTYTSKCGIPMTTVLLTALTGGFSELPNPLALASLVPIAVGIACASWNSPSFEVLGFLAAVTSTLAQSALNVSSKKAMMKTGIRGADAQRAMVAVGLVLAIVSTCVQMLRTNHPQESDAQSTPPPPLWLGGAAVAAYHAEYVLSFMFVRLVQPITYGTCDAMRRLSIILAGRTMFGGSSFTHINVFGIALSILGALSYSIASTTK